jgi:hypothetical protein
LPAVGAGETLLDPLLQALAVVEVVTLFDHVIAVCLQTDGALFVVLDDTQDGFVGEFVQRYAFEHCQHQYPHDQQEHVVLAAVAQQDETL